MAAKQKILIVDDDNSIAELVSLYLIKECFEVKINDVWVPVRIEMDEDWYLVGLPLKRLDGLTVRM